LKFLELGLTLLQAPKCPFCGEDTITEEKRKSIQKEIDENKEFLKSIEEFEKDLNTLKIKKNVITKVNSFIAHKSNLAKATEELKEEKTYQSELQELNKVIEKYSKIETLKEQSLSILQEVIDIFSKPLSEHQAYIGDSLNEKVSILDKTLKDLSKILVEIIELVKKVRNSLVSKARDLSPQEKGKYQLFNNLLNLFKKIEYLKVALSYKAKIDLINDTIARLEQFEKRKAGELLEELSNDIQYYYNKLNPEEPIIMSTILWTSYFVIVTFY